MQRSIFWGVLFLPILAISMSCEDIDDNLEDSFGDESLEDRAVSVVVTYQAENSTAASGCQVASNHTGFTGSGFVDYGGNGTWIEWNNVTVSNQAKYNLTFRYAVGTSTRQSAVFVNGQNVGNVGFANTGSWTNWKTDSVQVQLRQGKNTIRIMANTGSGGPNLDRMEISIDDLCPNDPNKTEPGECGCGVPEGSCDNIDKLLYEEKFDSMGGSFRCTRNTCSWTSKTIDVSGSTKLMISADTKCFEVGQFESADYIRMSYSIDGGAFVTFFENRDDLKTQNVSELVSNNGRSMRIKIDAKTSANNETYVVDNLAVKGNGGNIDQCPNDPNKTEPGLCGCGIPEGTCDECTNTLLAHEKLLPGEHICSENGKYEFGMSSGGELALRSDSGTLWSAGTFGSSVHLIMQGDGNLVVYKGTAALWDSKTNNNNGATLKLENDGRVVIRLGGTELWSQSGDDNVDQCPNDPNKTEPGQCGCGVPEGSCGGKVDASTLNNKIMAGYQGWFYAKNDGGYNKWNHWCNNKEDKPRPNNVLFDMWPDLREFPASELYPTGFTYANGRNAGLYSAHNASTVDRHMKWCQDYGIDGVFVQRFMASIHDGLRAYRDKVLLNVKAGAEKHGRVFVNMWDINSLESKDSGWHDAGLVDKIKKDWMHLVDDVGITGSDRYLKHNGKPLVAIWGVSKMTVMDAQYANDLVDWFQKNAAPKYRASVMLGVTNEVGSSNVDWQKKSSSWQNVFRKVDVISPWTVGRFKSESGADDFYNKHIKPDKQKCDEYGVDYFPVVFPGFSACQKHDKPCNACPRNGGKFLWRQFYNVLRAGSKMVYVAMFDEVDEGTAIYKLAENQKQTPVEWPSNNNHHEFIVMDADGYNLPSDWYLRLTGEASKMLRKDIDLTATIPIQP